MLHVFDLLQRHGVNEAVMLTSYLAETFEFLVEVAATRGLTLEVSQEVEPLGTAGALKNAEAFAGGEAFLAFNGDVLVEADLTALVEFHRAAGAEGTILLTPVEDPSAYGVVTTTEEGRVLDFVEKPAPGEAPTNLINAGVYVLDPSVLERVPRGEVSSLERDVFPGLVAEGARLFAIGTDAYWMDIGTPEKYLQANLDALDGRWRAEGLSLRGDRVASDRARIGEGAQVSSSCLGNGATVEPGATVTESVLLPGVRIGEDARVHRSVLGEGVKVLPGVSITGRTIGDDETVEE